MQPVRLRLGVREHVEIEICGPCGAGYFDYFAGEIASVARALVRLGALPGVPARAFDRPPVCPDCTDELALLPYLDDGPLLYRCDGCLAAFVTARQMQLLAAYQHTRRASIKTLRALGERLGVV